MKKILVVRIGALGDAIHALPMVNELHRREPESEIYWAAGPSVVSFLKGHSALSGFITVNKGVKGLFNAAKLVRKKFDCAIDAQGLIKSAFIAASSSNMVIGRAWNSVREKPASFFYTEKVEPQKEHIIEQNLELLEPLFPNETKFEIKYDIPIHEHPEWKFLSETPILFNIGGGWWTKLWERENFVQLANRIDKVLGLPVGIVWGPGEEDNAKYIAAHSSAQLAPPTLFRDLAGIFSKARLLVSGETGPLHLAVAVGCRTIALLGPTAGTRNGPYGKEQITIEPQLPCRPCHSRTCADFRCMPMITPDRVFNEIANKLER